MSDSSQRPMLNLPPFDMKIIKEDGILKIFDNIRMKYVALTPEEYVRQHFVHWLCDHLHYPGSIVTNEIGIKVNGTLKRCDTVVMRPGEYPIMIVEYKAPGVAVTQTTFDQIVRYNMALKASYLVVSNGFNHYCCRIDYTSKSYQFIPTIPDYNQITAASREN